MQIKEQNKSTGAFEIIEADRELINANLYSGTNDVLNYLCVGKVAQHRDEARILLARVLSNPFVLKEIEKQAKSLLDKGRVGFGYEQPSPYYKNVNFDENEIVN